MRLWPPRILAIDEKHLQLTGIHPYLAVCLFELPAILAQRDHPSAHDRIFPPLTGTDPKANTEWHELVGPDLRHLFVSAGQTVERDLTAMQEDPLREKHLQVIFPVEHLAAWMSAINEARLILGALHQVNEEDMHLTDPDPDPDSSKTLAILKIDILAELMAHLVEFANPEPDSPPESVDPQPSPPPEANPASKPKSKHKPPSPSQPRGRRSSRKKKPDKPEEPSAS